MGNCECYGGSTEDTALTSEYCFKDHSSVKTVANQYSNSLRVLPLPRINRPSSLLKQVSTIKVEATPANDTIAVLELSELVKKTLSELPQLQYDEIERGQHWKCQKFFDTQNIYEGQVVLNGDVALPHGRGKLYYTDGSLFCGTFARGKAQGRGRMISPNGSYYEGVIHNNRMEGNGQIRDSKGMYDGAMISGVPHGEGTFKTDKLEFKGMFQHGQKTFGTLVWGDNKEFSYTGNIKNDMFNSEGKLKSPGGIYEGNFVDGLKNGFGVFIWLNGKKFEGNYSKDKKCGYGQYYDQDGTPIYKGQWESDKMSGRGIEFKRIASKNKLILTKVECKPIA